MRGGEARRTFLMDHWLTGLSGHISAHTSLGARSTPINSSVPACSSDRKATWPALAAWTSSWLTKPFCTTPIRLDLPLFISMFFHFQGTSLENHRISSKFRLLNALPLLQQPKSMDPTSTRREAAGSPPGDVRPHTAVPRLQNAPRLAAPRPTKANEFI